MINKESPKKLNEDIYNFPDQDKLIKKIIHTQKLHIKKQVESGATIIQIFDSWAGLLDENKKYKYIYEPTKEIVDYTKSLGVEVICFPRLIKSYKDFCDLVKPNVISMITEVGFNQKLLTQTIDIPTRWNGSKMFVIREK